MIEISDIVIVLGTFMVAGTVKGIIGLGLPTVSLALLTVAIDLPTAMALLLIPSFITNVWQALVGEDGRVIFKRIWLFLLMATVSVSAGATMLTRVNLSWLSALLGVLLAGYSLVSLGGFRFRVNIRHETWMGSFMGLINGILTGMTGSFAVPGVMFLQALDLSRDNLVQAMGMLFTLSTLALAFALQRNDFLTIEQGALSLAALLPALIGMVCGRQIRKKLSEQRFRKLFFSSLLMLGVYILFNSVMSLMQ